MEMNDVIDRLRASQEEADAEAARTGERAGRAWAQKHAKATELRRLARAHDPVYGWQFQEEEAPLQFVRIIDPDNSPNWTDANQFWGDITGEDESPDGAFIEAFASGALDLWDEVKQQL